MQSDLKTMKRKRNEPKLHFQALRTGIAEEERRSAVIKSMTPCNPGCKVCFATPEAYAMPVVSKQWTYCSTIAFNVAPCQRSLV